MSHDYYTIIEQRDAALREVERLRSLLDHLTAKAEAVAAELAADVYTSAAIHQSQAEMCDAARSLALACMKINDWRSDGGRISDERYVEIMRLAREIIGKDTYASLAEQRRAALRKTEGAQ